MDPALSISTEAVASGLGYLITFGSVLLYSPQIFRIVRSRSAAGLSLQMYWLKLTSTYLTALYDVVMGFPISTYGENLAIIFQLAVLVVLVAKEQSAGNDDCRVAAGLVLYLCIAAAVLGRIVPPEESMPVLTALQLINSVSYPVALLPQLTMNYQSQSTGQYSPVTCSLALGGCAARIFTTLTLMKSALGFKDRSTGARFDVSVLLIQNRATAKLQPVTHQGLERVSRAFGQAVSDAGVHYSTEWGVEFCWQAAARARAQTRDFREAQCVLDRFRTLMKGGVAAGLLLNNLRGELVSAVQRTGDTQHGVEVAADALIPTVSDFWRLLNRMPGLARGVLDRNVAMGFGVCLQVYQSWLRAERQGGNYSPSEMESAEVVRKMKLAYKGAGLDQVATFFLDGSFGVLYLIVKHKDETLCAKRRPVVPCFNAPDRMLQNRVGRALCFFIDQLDGHFNVAATQEISSRLAKFNAAVKRHDTVMAASFDVKEMCVFLKPAVLLQATELVVMQAMGDKSGVLVSTRGRRGVSWYAAITPRRVALKMTATQILAGVRFILDNGFLSVAGDLVRQVSGIGIGGGASPGLAQCVCVFGEM
ncbi:hypothetical protein CYMTET_11486 [Cymbomonas tetramitiformis]|uniref:Uncharacterized protein n=1 Tax=Cymbomonas tetramitiformis TaxID=36881 RepID=A0AAE0GM84_9CHLO|nr:hypothetical protein CYMTET_11486 [Cymbomonas tetramitiformis]